jgi:hypothetical protein
MSNKESSSKGYGHWMFLPGGQLSYVGGAMTALHPHHEIRKTKHKVKKITKAKMHELESNHDHQMIIVGDSSVPHNDLRGLTEAIKKILRSSMKVKRGSSKHGDEHDMAFGNTSIFANTSRDADGMNFVIIDGNGHPVMVTKRESNHRDPTISLLNDVAEYLAHEHHRLAWHIHDKDNNEINGAPDHILPSMSALRCWPMHDSQMIFRCPPLIDTDPEESDE